MYNKSKKRKRSFFDFEKNIRKHTYSFRGHVISPVFNTQLPEVRNVDVVFTFTRNLELCVINVYKSSSILD